MIIFLQTGRWKCQIMSIEIFFRPLIAIYFTDMSNHFRLLFYRSVRRRKDDHLICAWGVSGVTGYSSVQLGRRQHSSRPEQELGFHPQRPRGKHPSYFWGREAICWRRYRVFDIIYLTVQKGKYCVHFLLVSLVRKMKIRTRKKKKTNKLGRKEKKEE